MKSLNIAKHYYALQIRKYADKPGIFKNMYDKFRKELDEDKELKDNLDKFKKSKEQFEQSPEIQKIRNMYKKMEKEIPSDTSEKFVKVYRNLMESMQKEKDQFKKKELFKTGMENISKLGEALPKNFKDSEFLKQAAEMSFKLEQEFRNERYKVYQAPEKLRTRNEVAGREREYRRIIEANESATGMLLHKDSKWMSAWSDFKDNNQYLQKMFTLKTQYDESDSLPVRSVRWFTDKLSSKFGKINQSEMTQVIKEIHRIDSSFTTEEFLRYCQFEMIPNVLEAVNRAEIEILKDWCLEAAFNVLSTPLIAQRKLGYKFDCRILDIDNVELLVGKIMEQGPVLIIQFNSQQIHVVRDALGKVISGDPTQILYMHHIWVVCRDQSDLDPCAAWKVMETHSELTKQLF